MEQLNRSSLKHHAQEALQDAAYEPRKLVLIHTGASVAVAILLGLISFLLDEQIGSTGGLGGMQQRSILETAQTLLQIFSSVAVLYWKAGFLAAMLRIARHEKACPDTLLTGFRSFSRVTFHSLLKGAYFALLLLVCLYLASFAAILTPLSQPLEAYVEQTGITDPNVMLTDPAYLALVSQLTVPMSIVFLLIAAPIMIPAFYRYRMSLYLLMRAPELSPLLTMNFSKRMMKGRKWQLFTLDLSFWWYYLLQAAALLPTIGYMALTMLGIALPWSELTQLILVLVLNGGCLLAVEYFAKARFEQTYVQAYDRIYEAALAQARDQAMAILAKRAAQQSENAE